VSKPDASSPNRIVSTMNAVMEIGFDGCSIDDIARHTGITYHSARRALEALEASGWVMDYRQKSSNQKLWAPGDRWIEFAIQYKRHQLDRIHDIESEYARVTGEMLRDER
jgi:DNA-binding IclR family transcriptional regulator